mmetsp:Transcript_20769/g.29162  ORF Transcript_20769/g.29162 Transcript_20769/m.29162 type:complete len:84 (+) Transcript_20769:136-387(+)
MVWKLNGGRGSPDSEFGYAQRALRGHNHFVSDVVISSDGQFALSGLWDGTLRLWEINCGKTTRRFVRLGSLTLFLLLLSVYYN